MIDVSEDRFFELVSAAFDAIPTQLSDMLDNVVLFVEDDAPSHDPHLLGSYEGIPLTERGFSYGGAMPDRIFVYRNPILAMCETEEDVVREVRITVVHEIAHFFGIEDDRLHELGYA